MSKNRWLSKRLQGMGLTSAKRKTTCRIVRCRAIVFRFSHFSNVCVDEKNEKLNGFAHSAKSKECGNRFGSCISHFVLKAVIWKTEYGFVFRFSWYRSEWGKRIHGIYTDLSGSLEIVCPFELRCLIGCLTFSPLYLMDHIPDFSHWGVFCLFW